MTASGQSGSETGIRIVTGMHRSGTSMAARMLHEAGVDLGGRSEMLATDEWNIGGYFENLPVVLLNDRIVLGGAIYLDRFSGKVSAPRQRGAEAVMAVAKLRYLFLRSARGVRRRALAKAAEIESLAAENDGRTVKDPRFSLTLDAWRAHARVDSALYCFRDPLAVARSLRRRDRLPLSVGLRLWRVHVEAFLASAGGLPVLFLDYDAFFDPDRRSDETARCLRFAGRCAEPELIDRIADGVVTSDWRHHTGAEEPREDGCSALLAELRRHHAADLFPAPFRRRAEGSPD